MLRFSGLPLLIRETLQRRVVTVVLFHDPDRRAFARQVAALKRRYTVVSLQSYLKSRAGDGSGRMPAKSLIITLDDGHRGNAALLETVRAEGVPVTIFLCSGIVGTRRRFWFEHELSNGDVPALKLVPDDARLAALAAHGFSDEAEFEPRQALSLEEFEQLRPYIDFQAHTVTHPILPNCSDAKAAAEIANSKIELEALGLEVTTLSYPNGDYTSRELAALEAAGYTCGITVDAGYNTQRTDLRRLKRIGVSDDATATELIVKASGLVDLAKVSIDAVRGVGRRRRAKEGLE
ncbi:MAG: polysaccharide deacetylase family protein [Gaiellaceae bacterium]